MAKKTLLLLAFLIVIPASGQAQSFATSPSSGQQTVTSFNYSGNGLTPGGSVQRFGRRPNGIVDNFGNMTANGAGQISWNYTYNCSDLPGTHAIWIRNVSTNWTSPEVTNSVSSHPSCANPVFTTSPSSGQQTVTSFNYSGNGLTPGGQIERFSRAPGQAAVNLGNFTASSSGQISWNFTYPCSLPTGIHEIWIRDITRNWTSPIVTNNVSSHPSCANPVFTTSPSSGQQTVTSFNYSGNGLTPGGQIERFSRAPGQAAVNLGNFTASSSGQISWNFTYPCSLPTGIHEIWIRDITRNWTSPIVTNNVSSHPSCANPVFTTSPSSGQQTVTSFNYSGNGLTPGGQIERFSRAPGQAAVNLGNFTASSSGQISWNFTYPCSLPTGIHEIWIRDITRNWTSPIVTNNVSSHPSCANPVFTTSPSSGQQTVTSFNYSGNGLTPGGQIERFSRAPGQAAVNLGNFTASSSGQISWNFTYPCSLPTGIHEIWIRDITRNWTSPIVTNNVSSHPSCANPVFTTSPSSGQQTVTSFNYSGNGLTPGGQIERFSRAPGQAAVNLGNFTASSSGQISWNFTYPCSLPTGIHEIWIRDITRNWTSPIVTNNVSSHPSCANPVFTTSPSSGQQTVTSFNYSGNGLTPGGQIERFSRAPGQAAVNLGNFTASSSGQISWNFTYPCSLPTGIHEIWIRDITRNWTSPIVTNNVSSHPSCANPVFTTSPSSGQQTVTSFNYSGNGLTPGGQIERFSRAPGQAAVNLGNFTASSSGQISWNFTYPCSLPTGIHEIWIRDITRNWTSPIVTNNVSSHPSCANPVFTTTPSSGQQTVTSFNYSGNGLTPGGQIERFSRAPGQAAVNLGNFTASSSGHISWNFTYPCSLPTGIHEIWIRDIARNWTSPIVTNNVSSHPSCATPSPAPVITGMNPQIPLAAGGNQPVVVLGNNFLPNLSVSVFLDSSLVGTLSGQQITGVSSTSFTMLISFNGNPGNYAIRVKNQDNRESNHFPFTVQSLTLDRAAWVTETYADGTSVNPGQSFNKTWTIRNSGTTTWDSRYKLRWHSGANLSSHADVAVVTTVPPGSNYTFPVPMTAPSASGTYREDWRFVSPSGSTIAIDSVQTIWVIIRVGTTCSVPSISRHPRSQSVTRGERITLTVESNATSYQWYTGVRGDTSTPIPGAVSNSYTTMRLFNDDYYWVRAGNSCGTTDSTAAVLTIVDAQPPSSLVIIGIEVTQAIQNLENDVPLIKDKRTFVRVHVKSTFGAVGGVTAELIARRNGIMLPESPKRPINSPIIVEKPSRALMDESFLFELPKPWTSGTITLDFRGVSRSFNCSSGLGTGDCSLANVTFYDALPASVRLLQIGGVIPQEDIRKVVEQIEAIFPIPRLDWDLRHYQPLLPTTPSNKAEFSILLSELELHRSLDCAGSSTCKDKYLGIIPGIPTGSIFGMANNSSVGAGYFYGTTLPHELAHTFGRRHTLCRGEDNADQSYPYFDATISPDKSDRGFFGFDIFDISQSGIYGPHSFDLMSYCTPAWVSDHTYIRLSQSSQSLVAQETANSTEVLAAGQLITVISGSISFDQGTGQIQTVHTFESAGSSSIPNSGSYAIRFENAQAQTLAMYSFAPEGLSDGTAGLFSLVLPWNNATARIVLSHNGQEINSRRASADAPRLTIDYPNGGEFLTGSTATLRWSASDSDGDSLTYAVQYSNDAGSNWNTLATGLTSSSFDLNLSTVAGTDRGLIRILASDGFLTATDQSDNTFRVNKHAPHVMIRAPEKGKYSREQTIVLDGAAYDNEDGALRDESLTWSSSLNGVLGDGNSIVIPAQDLSQGTHTLILTATDSDGQRSSTSITIQVSHQGLPTITAASIIGKKLIITGENFESGAAIWLDGEKQKTANDDQAPASTLIGKKAGKKIRSGQTVTILVRNPDGTLSNAFSFTRP